MKPHKHAELIKAWADGAEIECFENRVWVRFNQLCHIWDEKADYRIRPEPKPDVVHETRVIHHKEYSAVKFDTGFSNLKLTFDGETGELKDAEVLK